MKISKIELIGWAGLVLLNFSAFPTIYYFLIGANTLLPQINHLIINSIGMTCFLPRTIERKDWALLFFTSVGLISHFILLALHLI